MKYFILPLAVFTLLQIPSVTYYTASVVQIAKVSAYTSDVAETDDTPTITASGTTTRHGVVANNCLEFGTEVQIDGRTFVVEDRMNVRYGCDHYDIWMPTKSEAREWGVKQLAVNVK